MLAVLSGVLVAVAFPPWNVEWIIWVAFIPVLFALLFLRSHWLTALAQGAVFGAVFGGIAFFWRLTAPSALMTRFSGRGNARTASRLDRRRGFAGIPIAERE